MSSETLREQIEKKLMMETSYFKYEDNTSRLFPCPKKSHLKCKQAKITTIPNSDLFAIYCDNKECDVFNSNCNEVVIIDTKEN